MKKNLCNFMCWKIKQLYFLVQLFFLIKNSNKNKKKKTETKKKN